MLERYIYLLHREADRFYMSAVAPYGSLDEASADIPHVMFNTVDNIVELQKALFNESAPWQDVIALSASETVDLARLYASAHDLIADLSHCLYCTVYTPDLEVIVPTEQAWAPLLLGLTAAARQAHATSQVSFNSRFSVKQGFLEELSPV